MVAKADDLFFARFPCFLGFAWVAWGPPLHPPLATAPLFIKEEAATSSAPCLERGRLPPP